MAVKKNKGHSRQERTSFWTLKILSQILQIFLFSFKELRSCSRFHSEEAILVDSFSIWNSLRLWLDRSPGQGENRCFRGAICKTYKKLCSEKEPLFFGQAATVAGSVIVLISIHDCDGSPVPSNLSVPIDFY